MKKLIILLLLFTSIAYGQKREYGNRNFISSDLSDTLKMELGDSIYLNSTGKIFIDSLKLSTSEFEYITVDTLEDLSTGTKEDLRQIIRPPHAYAYISDSSVLITLGVDTYDQITNNSDSIYNVIELSGGITFDADTFILPDIAAHYEIYVSFGFETSGAALTRIRLMHDNLEIVSFATSTTNNSSERIITIQSYINATGNDRIWFEIKTDNGEDVTMVDASLVIKYFHPL